MKKIVSIALNKEEVYARLKLLAFNLDISMSEVIRQAIDYSFKAEDNREKLYTLTDTDEVEKCVLLEKIITEKPWQKRK